MLRMAWHDIALHCHYEARLLRPHWQKQEQEQEQTYKSTSLRWTVLVPPQSGMVVVPWVDGCVRVINVN